MWMWELLRKFNDIELLENSQIAKCDLICRNYCILLKISKELSCKNFLRF
ncbi:hypothetical protein LEP1GSC077_4069 [Leptospira interrogans str. C10069]|uniref:Uncharacterized protein n=1 Tax=Leptospira interrogans serovar Hardjo str. Norma TaxID=1279460 RepID=A0A0M4MS26_LEPIR|nr:hypothetical protein G436_0719 [Leptospira interrogans serovar Hardjo str. Norma]EKO07026.1 hypothetical protein LEP1GSC077_4069 [Leptospira interrogans str. C10069]